MSQRTFPKPTSLHSMHLSGSPVLDELELVAWHETEAATWARRVLHSDNESALKRVLGDNPKLPCGLLAAGTDSLVIGLTRDGLMYENGEWVENDEMWGATVSLSESDVAFVARAFSEGCDSVLFRPVFPLAWLTEDPLTLIAATTVKPVELPKGARMLAIVDELDKNAVLELVALAPGPTIYRRHDGKWYEDEDWLIPLRSVDPPPIVVLKDQAQQRSVIDQVDEATRGVEFEPKVVKLKKVTGSAVLDDLESRLGAAEERSILAVAGKELSPGDIKSTERLRLYWTTGKGGLTKIRWGTPGSWTRCHRHLVKYLGPRAKGYCTNLCQRMGGFGVACHVGRQGAGMTAATTEKPTFKKVNYKKGDFRPKPRTLDTPHARKDRKTTRELTDAEIEQRREAARKSALARRKGESETNAAKFENMTLAQKVQFAAQLEQAARQKMEQLKRQIRGTDDPLKRADLQGQLDDLQDMLSAKDEWIRNARYNELKLADDNIQKVTAEVDATRSAYDRKLASLKDQRDALEIELENASEQTAASRAYNNARNQALTVEASELRDKAESYIQRASYANTEAEKSALMAQANKYLSDAQAAEGKRVTSDPASQAQDMLKKIRAEINKTTSERSRKIADGQAQVKAMRSKKEAIMQQYRDATEYLRSRRKTGTESEFFI